MFTLSRGIVRNDEDAEKGEAFAKSVVRSCKFVLTNVFLPVE